jgi:hypothetical protein
VIIAPGAKISTGLFAPAASLITCRLWRKCQAVGDAPVGRIERGQQSGSARIRGE